MKGIQIHEKSFTPKNCNVTIDGAAITALAGTQMLEAYAETAKVNHTVIGGNGRTVALGGFITGAGHSILAPRYGLAADHVLEMEAVTPTGEIVTLNECQNTDLFWAMRGVSCPAPLHSSHVRQYAKISRAAVPPSEWSRPSPWVSFPVPR